MNNMNKLVKQVISPIIFYFFLVLGFVAALLSGLVEYSVIKELFINKDATSYNLYIPLLVVIVLEGLKIFLHYVLPAHSRTNISIEKIKFKKFIKCTLVFFSLMCTLIYVSNTLYHPDVVNTVITEQKSIIQDKYEQDLEKNISMIKEDAEKQILDEKAKVLSIEQEIQKLDEYSYRFSYYNYLQEKERLESNKKEAEEHYTKMYDKIIASRDDKIKVEESNNKLALQDEISTIENSVKYSSTGDNSFLNSAISFFLNVFNLEYSKKLYYICVLIVALIISSILELVISFSFEYLSLDSEQIGKLFSSEESNTSIKNKAEHIIKICIKAFIMLSIYLVYQAFAKEIIDTHNMVIAFVSYLVSILLTSGRLRLNVPEKGSTEQESPIFNSINNVKEKFLPICVQMLLCIVGFIIMNIYYGVALPELIPTTVALSVGSVSGQIMLTQRL